jgi:hypothetical protein
LAALVLGTTTPDYEYFLHLNTVGRFAHTLPGLFLVCPAGWVSLWLFDRFGRHGVATLLPTAWQLPPVPASPYRVLPTSSALLLGAVSHVIWDGFTHASGWGVALLPGLVLATAGILNGLRFLSTSFQQFVVSGGVAVTLTLGLGLVLLGFFRAPSRAPVG